MWRQSKVAVVVPAYREMHLLPKTLETMPDYVDQVVVVDDGSPDDTYGVACDCADGDPRVEVVRLGFNYGVGRAISVGYRRALQGGADVVAVMAADAQMDPDDLRTVLAPVVGGSADYSKGDRLAHREAQRMPPMRRLGTRVLAWMTGVVAGHPNIRDSQCGYTAISAPMLRRLPLDELYPRYGYPNDMLIRLILRDARIAQPVVRPIYGEEISGLKISAVVGPITGILLNGLIRRLGSHPDEYGNSGIEKTRRVKRRAVEPSAAGYYE